MKTPTATLFVLFAASAPALILAGCDFNTYFDFEKGSGGEDAREAESMEAFLQKCSSADLASLQHKFFMAGIRDASGMVRCDEDIGGWVAPGDENRSFPDGNEPCCNGGYCSGNCTADNRTCGAGFACAPGLIIQAACQSMGIDKENCTEAFGPPTGTNNEGECVHIVLDCSLL
jgi:hypothetical protein